MAEETQGAWLSPESYAKLEAELEEMKTVQRAAIVKKIDEARQEGRKRFCRMNCFTVESAMSMVAGTARSMGVKITGESPLKKD